MIRTILALQFTFALGCSRPVPTMATVSNTATPWCFGALALINGNLEASQGCVQSSASCAQARKLAIKVGAVAGVRGVSACEVRP